MLFGRLAFIFEVMIYVGLGLLLVHLLVSIIGGGGETSPEADADLSMDGGFDSAAELDTPDLDVDFDLDADLDLDTDFDLDPDLELDLDADGAPSPTGNGFLLRFNLHCLCLAFVVMGAMGIFALETLTGAARLAMLAAGAALALAAYVLLYRFVIWPLKKNKANALNHGELRFRHARVIFHITPDCPGTIETRDAVGAKITYRAQIDTDICKLDHIEEGEEVIITDIDSAQKLCYVAPAQRKLLK